MKQQESEESPGGEGQQAGGRAPLPLLSVTVAASGRCRPGPVREDPSLSLSHPHPHLAGVGSPGGAGKGLAGPAHLTQLSRPRGSSLPPPHPSQASEPRQAPQARPDILLWGCVAGDPGLGSRPSHWLDADSSLQRSRRSFVPPSPSTTKKVGQGAGREGMEVVPGRSKSALRKPQAHKLEHIAPDA